MDDPPTTNPLKVLSKTILVYESPQTPDICSMAVYIDGRLAALADGPRAAVLDLVRRMESEEILSDARGSGVG